MMRNGKVSTLWQNNNFWAECPLVEEGYPPHIQTQSAKSDGV
jgi:hypothetical protein